MELNHEILKTLQSIEGLLAGQQTEYCDTQEAARIIGLDNPDDLKQLHDMGVLPRYQRKGRTFKYKKAECKKAAQALDNGTIKLKSQKHENNYQLRTA